jgi:hypothetical protein
MAAELARLLFFVLVLCCFFGWRSMGLLDVLVPYPTLLFDRLCGS